MKSYLVFCRHVAVLAVEELRVLLLRRKALLALIIYALVMAWAVVKLVHLQSQLGVAGSMLKQGLMQPRLDQMLRQFGVEAYRPFFEELLSLPASLWIFQFFVITWYPVFVMLLSYDAVALDTSRGTQRFLIQRCSRLSYITAKVIVHLVLYVSVHLVSVALFLFFCSLWIPFFDLAFYGRLAFFYLAATLPFIALLVTATLWISSISSRPGRALLGIHLFWFLVMIVGIWWPMFTPLRGEYLVGLLVADWESSARTAGFLSAWSLGFAALTAAGFCRREL